MQIERKKGIRLIRAIQNSLDGLKGLWLHEAAFRQEVYVGVVLLPVIYFLHVSPLWKLLLILLMLLVLVIEAINSALEALVDRISLEFNTQSKLVKDIGSAAVGIVLFMNLMSWVIVLYSHYIS